MRRNHLKILLPVMGVCILFPLMAPNEYLVHVACMIGIWIILAISLNLLYGYAGQISLGHGAFYGVGAYAVSYFEMKLGIPFVLSTVLAILTSGVFAFIIGIPTLRLRHHYLALATLGFNFIVEVVMIQWQEVTGGAHGLSGIPDLIVFGTLLRGRSYYYVVLVAVFLVYYANYHLLRSSFGRAFVAIRESEVASVTAGINTPSYKNLAFATSAMIAALAGCLYAHLNQYLSPDLFGVYTSISILSAIVLGGTGITLGAIIGATFLVLLPELLYVAADYAVLTNAVILLLVLLFLPVGIVGYVEKKAGKHFL